MSGKCDFSYCCDDVAALARLGLGRAGACRRHQAALLALAQRVREGADPKVVISVFLPRLSAVKRRQLLALPPALEPPSLSPAGG